MLVAAVGGLSWRMDETYIKVKGKWVYYYRSVDKVVIDKRDSNITALDTINMRLWLFGYMFSIIEVLTVKYLNHIVEQSHRKLKGKMYQCLGLKSWDSAESTLAGV